MSLRRNVVAAIVRKDLQALWPMAAIAVALVLADIVVAAFELGGVGGSINVPVVLHLVMQLTYALLVVAVIQQDTAVSVSHDWLTKPISRLEVVAAKGAFVALTMFVPIVVFRAAVYVLLGFSLDQALLTALDVDDIWILLALPLVVAAAAVTPTLLQAAAASAGLFMLIFVVPTLLPAFGVPSLDEGLHIATGISWILLWVATVAAICTVAAVLYFGYGKRSIGAARAVLACVPALVVLAPTVVGWPQLFGIQKAVAPAPAPGDDFAIRLNPGCFPAESTASLAAGSASSQTQLVGAGLWNEEDLQEAGHGAIAFATSVAPRDLEEDWRMRVSMVEATYVDARGNVLQRARPARITPVPRMTVDGGVASTNFWLLPSAAVEGLGREPTTHLSLTYSLALLEPTTAELAADGERRNVPRLGYCAATYDAAASTLAVDCFKRGAQPTSILAEIPGAPLRTVDTTGLANYEPAWLQVLTGRRHRLTLQVPAGVDASKVKLTTYEARSHFQRTVERPGVLGAPLADCPLPAETLTAPVERSVWRDTSPHNVLFVNVDDGVRLEVLDWGGSGRPVVLLHGLGGTAHGFDDFAPKLAERYRVIGITRRGVGASTLAETGYDLPRRTQDVLRVLDALEIDSSAIVMGHSLGGEELNELGARYSDRIAGLVYLDAAFDRTVEPQPELDAARNALPEPPPAKPENFASYPALRDYMISMGGIGLPEGEILATFAFTPSGSVGGRAFDARILEAIDDSAVKPDYAAFKVPALALYALPRSADDLMRPWYDRSDLELRANVQRVYDFTVAGLDHMQRRFEQEVPNGRAVNLLGAKHFIFGSNEAEVLAEIERFISELPPR